MRVLITRPRADSETFAAVLRARQHLPVIAPIMDVQFYQGMPILMDGLQAVLATSANGVRALAARTEKRDIGLYAVGPQTAEAARMVGFRDVFSANGDATALVEFVAGRLDPNKGALLHAAGTETAGRLHQALQACGFTVRSEILYTAVPMTALPEVAAKALRETNLDAVMLFSPRSAKIFAGLVADTGLAEACARIEAFCISAATAATLSPLQFARVTVAREPNQDSMLALLPAP